MATPYEILAAPFTLYVATAGTAEPDVDDSVLTGWTKLGANGDANYNEDGVTVTHEQEVATFSGLGRTGQLKAWRTNESMMVEAEIHDITAELYSDVLNNAAVTTTAAGAGVPGSKHLDTLQGYDVTLFALLVRGNSSPYGDGWNAQYWLPRVFQNENPAPVLKKGEPAGLQVSYVALEDLTDGFGVYRAQTADAT